MANPKQAAAVTDSVNISDGQSIGWGAAVEAAIDTKAAELEAAERSESYQPAKPKPLPKTHASVGPTNFPSKKPEVKEEVKPIETVNADPVKKSAAAVEPVEPPAPADQPKPLPIDAWVSAGMRAALSAAQQRGSRPLTQDEAIAAANSRIDAMAKSEGKTIDDYSSEAKRRGISLQTLINESAKEINNQWALSQTSARQSAAMSGVQAPAGPAPVKFDVASAEKAIKDKLYGEAKARGVDINATQPKILTATELRAEAVFKMSGQKSGFMGNPETSQDAEVSKPGEVGAQTAEHVVAELFSHDSDGTLGAYVQSLQNNPGGYEEWIKTESEKLLKQRGVRPGDPNFTEQQRLTRAQAANEVFAMKTVGLWTAPIFTNRDLQPDSYWDAIGPSIEVVGYGNEVVNGKPVVIQRQESWGSWFLNALDAPQYALVGVWDAAGKPNAPGESTADNVWKSVKSATAGRRFIFKAVTESESFQPRQVYNADGSLALNEKGEPLTTENWRPWVFGTVGFAASVFMPDAGTMLIFPTAAKIAKGFSVISESKRAEKGAEILTQIAASRTAAKAQFEESLALADEAAKATDPVTKAEKSAASLEARRQADSLFEAASAQERKLFAEQEGLAKHLDDTDGDAHKQMTSQASIDSANVHLARTIVDRADALETLHPSLRKPFKSIEGKASEMIPVGRKDLYDTHSQLKRAEDSFKNAKRLPETRAAVLSFISQPELDQLKSVLSETDYKEVLDQLPNAINNPNGFMQFMMTKRLNVQYPSGVTAASPAGHAWRQKVVAPGASIVKKAKNIDANVAAVERRVYDAILNNSESRAVAADTLANVLRKEGPRNIPSIDKVPDLGDPALRMAEGDVGAAVDMTDGAKKLVAQLRSAGLNKKQSTAIAALMDTRARTWAWKTGNSAEDWYKIGNADRISFVKEQAANVPMLQRGTSEFLFEGGPNSDEFKNWFGKSKAVDKAGNPRVAYHATDRAFGEFKPGLTYTTFSKSAAREYGDRVIPVFVKAERPKMMYDEDWRSLLNGPRAVERLKARGYDSAISDDTGDIVVFDSSSLRPVNGPKSMLAVEPTTTPEFNRWFNGSKVTDRSGRPLVVYHATNQSILAFNPLAYDRGRPTSLGSHFGDERTVKYITDASEDAGVENLNVMPVYLSIKNPLRIPDYNNTAVGILETLASAKPANTELFAAAKKIFSTPMGKRLMDSLNAGEFEKHVMTADPDLNEFIPEPPQLKDRVRAALEQAGYDGLVYKNRFEKTFDQSHVDSWAVLRPEQVKSVFNRGTFNPEDPRILFRRTAVDKAEAQLIVAIENVKDYRAHSVLMPVGQPIPLRSALSSIAESDPREHVKLIAKRLSESVTVDSSTVNIISGPNEDIAKLILAKATNENEYLIKYARENGGDLNYSHNASGLAYSSGPKTGRIEIKLPEVSGTANVPNLIVLHEATHIATSRYIAPMLALPVEEARKLPAEVKQATDKLRDTFKKVSQHIKDGNDEVAKVQYGLMNVHEFVAEAVANPHFQDILKSITLTNERKTVWSYFVETVAGLLGITHKLKGDALTETLAAFDKILTATSGPSFIKAAGATEDIERMENRLIELERAVAQKPHLGLSHNDEIRSLRKWIASAKRDAAKAAKVTAEPAKVIKPAPIPTGDVSTAKAHLAAMRKAEDDAKAIYADALAAKRANPKDKALKEAVDAARQKLAKAMSDTTDAERAAKVEIRAETKAQQAAELEDPDIKQAYARVRAAERKVNETNDAIEKSKLALADAVRNKNGPARRAAEREIATLEAALGTFEKSYNETRNVYKRLSDEFKARKAAEKAAEAVKAETAVKESTTAKAATETVADPEGTAIIQRPATEPVKSTGGLPVGTRSSNPEEEFIDLDETGTATQVTPPAQTSTHITPSTGTVNPPTPPVPPPPVIPPAIPPAPPALPKGAVAFYNDGRAIVYAFEKADINTFVHEIGHVVRRDLLDDEREALKVWLSAESGKSVEIDGLGNFVDSTTGTLFSKADSDALDELFTERFVDWMATSNKAPIKETSNTIHKVFESIKSWMLDAFNAIKATLPNAVSPEIDGFFTDIMSVSKDPTAVSSAFSAAKRVVEKKRGFIRGMIGPDAGSVELYVFDELAKGAKAGGLNVTPAQLENMLETRGTIEFPRPILGKTKYDANDIAALQKDLEEIGTTELYRSKAKLTASDLAKSVTEESTTDKLWNMLRDEPLNYDTIADPTKPRNPIAAFAKSIARAGVALYIGLDEMADLRHLPPAVRQTILSGVRVINSVYHDALKIAEERDSAKLIDYLTGKNVRFYNGRRVMTASWDSVSSVQMRLKNIIEACGPAMVADLHNLTHTPDFSNLNPAQSASVARAAEFVLNTTNSMYVKQLLQVLGASQPANKAYDAINTPKELILAKALVNFAYAAPTSGVTRFRDITGKLYGESSSVKALVLMAAHGQADRVRKTWFNAGIAVSSTDAALFKSWINAEYVPDSAMPAIKRVADTLGLNPTFVPALDAIGKYEVPAAAYDRLTSALAKANPEKQHWLMKSESDTAGSSGPMAALQAWVRWRKSSMVRGSLLVRSRLLTSNSMDLILMVGNNLGLGVAAAAAGRVAAQTTLALAPGVTRAIDVASRMGWANPKALENVRDAIQKGGDKFAGYLAKTMWDKAVSLDVNSLLSGEKKVFNMGGKVYSWSDLRQIALEEGVFDSLPASIESAVRRGVRPPSTTLEKVSDKFASYSEYVSDVQEGVSERERAGLMLTLMELGVNPRIAARLTVNTMFDYITTVASQERSLLLSLFEPFWPFIKNSGRSLVNNFFSGYGAHRIGLLRRATERSFDAINELVYDSITDPYGVDISALSDEGRDNYFEMRRTIESKYGGIEKVPLSVKLSIGSVFAGQTSYFLHDGKIYALKSRVGEIAAGTNNNNKLSPYIERLGLPARLDIEDAVIPRPDRSGSSSFYRDLYAMTIPMTLTKQTQRYMELAAPDHPFIEFLMPETYVQTSVRRMGGLTALAVLGAYGLWDSASGLISGAGPTDGEMEGLNWTRAGNITEQVLDPERSMLLPQAYGLLFDEDNSRPYRIHPILAKALDTIGVSHLSVNAAQDPFAVTFDTAAPTPTDVNASSESVNKNLLPGEASPDLGAGVTTTRHYLPAHWGVIIQSIPDLDGLNRELLRYNDAADLKPGSGPMERSADPLYPILASAYRVITGLSTAEPHRSKNALREEPRRDTKTTNPVK